MKQAGLYIHIPFCKKACHYCDFHFSTSLAKADEMVDAICRELELKAPKWAGHTFETIYFGGGTPSLLSRIQLGKIMACARANFILVENPEITLEANPDDLHAENLAIFSEQGVNRLSIGLQSFDENTLRLMNRSHTANQSLACISDAQKAGFDNLSIDLIYGVPGLSAKQWQTAVDKAVALNVQHISAYCLTIEKGTAFAHFVKKGSLKPVNQELAADHYDILVKTLTEAGFEHYEVSNFGKPNQYSNHNTAYWSGRPYLAAGPSAHEYDGQNRSWNVANNAKYIAALSTSKIPCETEVLSPQSRYNEYIMTGVRTRKGIDLNHISIAFGIDCEKEFSAYLQQLIAEQKIYKSGTWLHMTDAGLLAADGIAAALFVVD